jgi:hypothetical protein
MHARLDTARFHREVIPAVVVFVPPLKHTQVVLFVDSDKASGEEEHVLDVELAVRVRCPRVGASAEREAAGGDPGEEEQHDEVFVQGRIVGYDDAVDINAWR